MKRQWIVAMIIMVAAFGGAMFWPSTRALAACANVSSFGAVTMLVPELSHVQDQTVWLRMQGKAGDNVLVEINGDRCHEVKLQSDTIDRWTWQPLFDISFPESLGNELKIIGTSSGVRIDRVLVTEPMCTPADYGDSCPSNMTLTVEGAAEPTALTPPFGPVSGQIHLSPTVQQPEKPISRVVYTVNGQIIQEADSAEPFDSTLVENGRHTVHITTTFKDGSELREMVAIEIKNPENALSPVVRWMKRNQSSLQIIGLSFLILAGILASLRFITQRRRSKRERTFRGLS